MTGRLRSMRQYLMRAAVSVMLSTLAAWPAAAQMVGFTAEADAAQRHLEARFDALLEPDSLRAWMDTLTRQPFYVGAPYNREMAVWLRDWFRAYGFDSEIEEYRVLLPMPRLRALTLLQPVEYEASLAEPPIPGHAPAREHALPAYNAYSADGDVTGELVYVNYGVPADYEELERRGIDVRGRIVIARYGGSWRGIKPKVAAEKGAVGAILYSDPRDDGYYVGDDYPDGPWRPADGIQRGSVLDLPVRPGDPLTPGYGATADAPRVSRDEAGTLMTIPVLPISYADAQPLLEALDGPVAPAAWRGALPLTYHLGPGPARVRLRLEFDWNLVPAYNVIARMTGAELPEEWVVRGNHRDGWAMGARDPISGLVAMMAEARAIGELARTGWRPQRTIVYGAWDAEEPALLGSTEWVEHHADELRRHAVVYINTDSNARGLLAPGGSHTLERLINEIAGDVNDARGANVRERLRAARATGGDDDARARDDLRINALGSGSDWAPFQQHVGIASVMLSFGGEVGGGEYHSAYDTFDHYSRFIDPKFEWGTALARVAGRMTLRTAQADVVPLQFGNFAETVSGYVDEVVKLADDMRTETTEHNEFVERGWFELAANPTQPYVPPAALDPVPMLDFSALERASTRLRVAAARYDSLLVARHASGGLPRERARELNALLRTAERTLTRDEGLPGRPWYRHQVYAPGLYTGYGVKTLPGVREGIEQRDWGETRMQIGHAAAALTRMADLIEQATRLLAASG